MLKWLTLRNILGESSAINKIMPKFASRGLRISKFSPERTPNPLQPWVTVCYGWDGLRCAVHRGVVQSSQEGGPSAVYHETRWTTLSTPSQPLGSGGEFYNIFFTPSFTTFPYQGFLISDIVASARVRRFAFTKVKRDFFVF